MNITNCSELLELIASLLTVKWFKIRILWFIQRSHFVNKLTVECRLKRILKKLYSEHSPYPEIQCLAYFKKNSFQVFGGGMPLFLVYFSCFCTFIRSHTYITFVHHHTPMSFSIACGLRCWGEIWTRACHTTGRSLPTELLRTLTESSRTLTELRRTLLGYAGPQLSYAAPYWATPHPTELRSWTGSLDAHTHTGARESPENETTLSFDDFCSRRGCKSIVYSMTVNNAADDDTLLCSVFISTLDSWPMPTMPGIA